MTVDSGFSLDVVHNHVLGTGYAPGIIKWSAKHPLKDTAHFGRMAVAAMIGRTV